MFQQLKPIKCKMQGQSLPSSCERNQVRVNHLCVYVYVLGRERTILFFSNASQNKLNATNTKVSLVISSITALFCCYHDVVTQWQIQLILNVNCWAHIKSLKWTNIEMHRSFSFICTICYSWLFTQMQECTWEIFILEWVMDIFWCWWSK